MQRRDVSKLLLASVAGSAALTSRAQAQTCTPPCYPQTASELAASITPVDTSFPPGNVKRYGAIGKINADKTWPDDHVAIQKAIDSGAGVVFFPNGTYKIGAPLRIKPVSTQNLTLLGEGRTNTYLAPLHPSIADDLGQNAMIINQAGNGKLTIRNLRFWGGGDPGDLPYTGSAIYAVEGGCNDHSGQAIFSGSIDNCWFDLGNTSKPVFVGGLNNYRVSNCTFENAIGCFFRQGLGMGDVTFSNNVTKSCYDAFYDGMSDAIGDNIITIDGLHVYSHLRGQVIRTQNSTSWIVSNVIVQADTSSTTVGLFSFTNCSNIVCSNFNAAKVTVFGGSGALGEAITINSSSVKLSNGIIDGATFGVRLTGNGQTTLTIADVDIVNSSLAAFAVQDGSPSGRVTVHHCNWSDANGNIVVFTNAANFDMFVSNCRLMNAGLTTSGGRNINIATRGTVYFDDCVIGQNNFNAQAAFYIDAAGTGTVTIRRPVFLGTPPSGTKTGSQPVSLISDPAATTL